MEDLQLFRLRTKVECTKFSYACLLIVMQQAIRYITNAAS
jgi:hypothetical protein